MDFFWNNFCEVSLATFLGQVPGAGPVLNALVFILWPQQGDDTWSDIKDNVEQLIGQEIEANDYATVQTNLQGLQNVLGDYAAALETVDYENIFVTFKTVDGDFDLYLPNFGYADPGGSSALDSTTQVLLAPLFAQFANLNLALLREGVLSLSSWGQPQAVIDSYSIKLTSKIANYTAYAQTVFQQGYETVGHNTKWSPSTIQPFRSVNAYLRQMTLSLMDFAQAWPYLDPTAYPYFDPTKSPNPLTVYLGREIFADPLGNCVPQGAVYYGPYSAGPINIAGPTTQPLYQVTVWGADRVDAFQCDYPPGGGPGGITSTGMDPSQTGDSAQEAQVFSVWVNPIIQVSGLSGDIINAGFFGFADGTTSPRLGGNYQGGNPYSFAYQGEVLSSIHVNAYNQFYNSADSAVFGFRYAEIASGIPTNNLAVAFDYNSTGKLDHLFVCTPGTGVWHLLGNNAGKFAPVGATSYVSQPNSGGFAGYDLMSPQDQVLAFDYATSGASTGNLDHLVFYRPGTGVAWIMENSAGTFAPVFKSGTGVAGFDLSQTEDLMLAFDYDSTGKQDHLVLYRPGQGAIVIAERQDDGSFAAVYTQADGGTGIGGFDLSQAEDRIITFDYDSSGKLDHLVCYRPGTGIINIMAKQSDGTFASVYTGTTGIGGFDLSRINDHLVAIDYKGTGNLDHLLAYRQDGTTNGVIWILEKAADGTFSAPYATDGLGIGGYALTSSADRAFVFDYNSTGKADHVVFYRPGTNQIYFLANNSGQFSTVYGQLQLGPAQVGYSAPTSDAMAAAVKALAASQGSSTTD
jgi:hypothetical protein